MEMAWRTCPQCTGEPPLMQPEPRGFSDMSDATRIIEPTPVAVAPVAVVEAPPSWALVVTEGILLGQRIELQGKGVRVGRAPKLAGGQDPVELPDLHLSRDHFAVVPDGDGWAIHDLGSTNGTKVNGEKVNRRTLAAGDEVRAGHTTFVFESGYGDGSG